MPGMPAYLIQESFFFWASTVRPTLSQWLSMNTAVIGKPSCRLVMIILTVIIRKWQASEMVHLMHY